MFHKFAIMTIFYKYAIILYSSVLYKTYIVQVQIQ